MQPETLEQLLKLFDKLSVLESSIAAMYAAAAKAYPAERDFFAGIAVQENEHSLYVIKLRELIRKKPGVFEAGSTMVTLPSIEMVASNVKRITERLSASSIDLPTFISTAYSIEESLLENKYYSLIISKDVEFKTVIEGIIIQTDSHRKLLAQKRANMSRPT